MALYVLPVSIGWDEGDFMTCIVGLVKDGVVWVGGDRLSSNAFIKKVPDQSKVFFIGENKEFLFGGSGTWRMIDFMQHEFVPPIHPDNMSSDRYMRTMFIKEIQKAFNDNDIPLNSDIHSPYFIIGYRGKLFEFQNDMSILTHNDMVSIGSGYEFAYGALYAMRNKSPKKAITTAIEAATEFCPSVGGGIDILKLES